MVSVFLSLKVSLIDVQNLLLLMQSELLVLNQAFRVKLKN